MKLATLKSSDRDGQLIVVSKDGTRAVRADHISPNLRTAVENWSKCSGPLHQIYDKLNSGIHPDEFQVDVSKLHSAFPRSFQWADGSAFLHHVKLVRQARGASLPENLYRTPLMYQGGSDNYLASTEDITNFGDQTGIDFEAEVAVVTDDVPMGISAEAAIKHIVLIVLVNDVSLRGLIPEELANGFGFFQSKPSSALSPFAVTPDELGDSWVGARVELPLLVDFNGKFFGKANGREMHFHFGELIAHAARTRNLAAGCIVGSGTFSNEDPSVGSSCLVEKRMIEKIETGEFKTPFMKPGDRVQIKMLDKNGLNIFGTISQKVANSKS